MEEKQDLTAAQEDLEASELFLEDEEVLVEVVVAVVVAACLGGPC